MVTNGEQPGNVPVKVNPPTREGWQHWTKELKKKEPVFPLSGKYFHSNVLVCPHLPLKVYAVVPIFIWFKMFQTSLVFNFLLFSINYHNLKQKEI